ncbi:hypothetical protein B0H13DRAFT_1895007 [Mycena leptocephala]|nr:hypothetical protein B0H13DRAFT_1895007 [Mycena leptocephala]
MASESEQRAKETISRVGGEHTTFSGSGGEEKNESEELLILAKVGTTMCKESGGCNEREPLELRLHCHDPEHTGHDEATVTLTVPVASKNGNASVTVLGALLPYNLENPEGWNEILQGWLKLPDKPGRRICTTTGYPNPKALPMRTSINRVLNNFMVWPESPDFCLPDDIQLIFFGPEFEFYFRAEEDQTTSREHALTDDVTRNFLAVVSSSRQFPTGPTSHRYLPIPV